MSDHGLTWKYVAAPFLALLGWLSAVMIGNSRKIAAVAEDVAYIRGRSEQAPTRRDLERIEDRVKKVDKRLEEHIAEEGLDMAGTRTDVSAMILRIEDLIRGQKSGD